ncbi:MAG: DUF4296 domain-containing protein [Flavobacteriia bacterium]|nr:DUF4296 domain-containing protein [Flavobacteriia bacterium]OJX34898.1 MAG: hypothetical protein BGO87_09150 [Flavobacteriia bacterium 40-80]
MKKFLCFLSSALFLGSCNDARLETSVPKDIIPVDTMIMVMSDVLLMENALQRDYPQLVSQVDIVKNSGDSILQSYSLNFDRYKRSFEYYAFYQDTMNYIYDRMSDRITIQMNESE